MADERRRRAEELLRAIVDLPADQQDSALREGCGSDVELRRLVELLLRSTRVAPPPRDTSHPTATVDPGSGSGFVSVEELRHMLQRTVGDRYRIADAASGGMGHVFSAYDTVLECRVAIKVPRTASSAIPETREPGRQKQILAEARAMANLRRLRNPNLCPVQNVVLEGRLPYIVMDWIDGIRLTEAWRDADPDQRLSLFVKVVEAVAAVHDAGCIHGDLKPDNILVERSGEPVIVDFGLARTGQATERSWVGGTPGYAAPEQFERGRPLSATVDVYALGIIMYEMLTNRAPFAAESIDRLLKTMQEEDPPLPATYAPETPWPLQRICLAALERDPALRYPDARAMARDLERYLRRETVAARPTTVARQFTEQVEHQLDQVEAWHRQGLVTDTESNRLSRVLSGLLRPEAHWILESRRLSPSQVTLYLGGWLVFIGVTIGMAQAWDALELIPSLRFIIAWSVFAAMLGFGIVIEGQGHRRIALGYLLVACLVVPVATGLLLYETEWLGTPMTHSNMLHPWEHGLAERSSRGPPATAPSVGFEEAGPTIDVNREWLRVLAGGSPPEGWRNRQMLVIMATWLLIALSLRLWASSSAFTIFSMLAAAGTAVMAWASAGLLSEDLRAYAMLGAWVLTLGVLTFGPGLALNRREEERAQQLGRALLRAHDSWIVLLGSVVMMAIGLTMLAWNAGDIYTFKTLPLVDDEQWGGRARSTLAVALMVNGLALQLAAWSLARRRTVVRARLAELLRWITPSHWLGALLLLHTDPRAADLQQHVSLIALAAAAVVFCYLSVRKQWKPFLFNGLFYIGVAYWRMFLEVEEAVGTGESFTFIVLLGLIVLVGLVTMFAAWKVPAHLTRLRLTRPEGRGIRGWSAATLVGTGALLSVLPITHYLDRLAVPDQRLVGSWIGGVEGATFAIRFRSDGVIESREGRELARGQYMVDFAEAPAHLDVTLEDVTSRAIVAFEGDAIRIEVGNEARPVSFGPESIVLARGPYWRRLLLTLDLLALAAVVVLGVWKIPRWTRVLSGSA